MGLTKHILVIPGDGIGPEVTTWGKAVLEKIGQDFGHEFTYDEALMGHAAIEATGSPLVVETKKKTKKKKTKKKNTKKHIKYDNDPSAKVRPEQGLLGI